MSRSRSVLVVLVSVSLQPGCASVMMQAREAPGPLPCAIAGGVVGGVAGAVVGHNNSSENPLGGFAVGAASGAAVGALICTALARPNMGPSASVSGGPYRGMAPLTVRLRADASDPDGEIVGYTWELGDGTRADAPELSHTYTQAGEYTVQLTITDDGGLTAMHSVRVSVEPPPVAAPPPARRPPVTLDDVHFEFDSARLQPTADSILVDLLRELQGDPKLRVRVSGHTDDSGPEIYNQGLSERRAQSVTGYLRERGIDASRIEAQALGESRPRADNATREGRKRNRRVELLVLD